MRTLPVAIVGYAALEYLRLKWICRRNPSAAKSLHPNLPSGYQGKGKKQWYRLMQGDSSNY